MRQPFCLGLPFFFGQGERLAVIWLLKFGIIRIGWP